jgi:UDP-N-acetylglucosamine 1-carboxyvinyltransferase
VRGGRALRGTVRPAGNKNAALPILAATVLADGPMELDNIPHIRDVETMLALLVDLGASAEWTGPNALRIDTRALRPKPLDPGLCARIRASILLAGPLLARFGSVTLPPPGGDVIGRRRVDTHFLALEQLGASVMVGDRYELEAKGLTGNDIFLDEPSVTGTENALMAAVMAEGRTVLRNAAAEPHVQDVARLLVAMGAQIEGIGTSDLTIHGVNRLHGATYMVLPDRIEAGSYACAAAITGGEVLLKGAKIEDMEATVQALRDAGVHVEATADGLHVAADGPLKPVTLSTAPYPGFATDMQAQLMALLCRAEGSSVLTETIFENRYMHVPELNRMGAHIETKGRTAVVHGVQKLTGAEVMATDLRASMSLVIAGLAAEGETQVHRLYHLDRGYERLEEKLALVGAQIERVGGE